MPTNYLTLTRQSLYDLVWSKPMSELAKEFGISDVGLAKRCRAVDVPVPPRGWWAKHAADHNPPRTPLPKYRDSVKAPANAANSTTPTTPPKAIHRDGAEPRVTFSKPAVPPPPKDEQSIGPEQAAIAARIDALAIRIPATLRSAHPAIKRTAIHLRNATISEVERDRSDARGPLVDISVSKLQRTRALKIASALLHAAAELGWTYEDKKREPERHSRWAPPQAYVPTVGHLLVEQEPIAFKIDEHHRQVEHVLTASEKASKDRGFYHGRPWDLAPTGELRLHMLYDERHAFHTLKDAARKPLEQKIVQALLLLHGHAMEGKERRAQESRAEEARRERERLEQLADQRRKAQAELIAELERQAGAWFRARLLRAYAKAAKRQLGVDTVQVKLQDSTVDFIDWALAYADQLDPLSATPRHPDQKPSRNAYYHDEDKAMQQQLLRLLGHDGKAAWKLRG